MADMTANSSRSIGERSVFWMIVATGLGTAAIIAIAMSFIARGEVAADTQPAANDVEQAPTGAGTNPDGVADESTEGLMNETTTDDFVDSSAAASVDSGTEGTAPEPQASATEVEPAVGDGTVNEMTPAPSDDRSSMQEQSGATDSSEGAEASKMSAASEENADAGSDTGLTLVDDPDNGQPNEPDGGAQSFYPTPSGPEGRDDDPFTTN